MQDKKKKSTKKAKSTVSKIPGILQNPGLWKFYLPIMALTFALFIPSLQNNFTNWDDILYVTQNPLLTDFNLSKIFSTPVVSNYHPLTILSLAVNYQFAELEPMSYFLTNILLHVINTGLVFFFIYQLSRGNRWVSAAVALLFAIHPMHVESVSWVSERKDVLYTLFYLLAMISYVKYVAEQKSMWLIYTTVLGAISLLCKPAAIVLPLSLLLIDYFMKRQWNTKWIVEKIPLFAMSAIMAYVTVAIQAKRAIASVEAYNMVERICFAGFGWLWYILKAIFPLPLSALHPFPKELTPVYYIATAATVAIIAFSLWKIRNRNYMFGLGFYTVNLLLVLQLISIGNAVVAERYTYVPYIGLFFAAAMGVQHLIDGSLKKIRYMLYAFIGIWMIMLAVITLQRQPVWRNSQTLWEDVIRTYPESARAWTNKGLDYYDQKKWTDAIFHLSKALVIDSTYMNALEWRARTSLEVGEYERALTDAKKFARLYPREDADYILARSLAGVDRPNEAIDLYTRLINQYNKADYYNNRGALLFNKLKRYDEAKADFETAIRLSPNSGSYYLNLARCYYVMGDVNSARRFGNQAKDLGATVDEGFARAIGIQ
jgi:tetratricopeptide (TPR) repeat protein